MNPNLIDASARELPPSSLPARLLNVFVCPGEVFEEVLSAPPRVLHWVVPTFLVCIASAIQLRNSIGEGQTGRAVDRLTDSGRMLTAVEGQILQANWVDNGQVFICIAAFLGLFWAAFVLWGLGRLFLKARFSYLKTLEIVGLSSMVLALGAVVTTLMVLASGNVDARPALSLLAARPEDPNAFYLTLQAFDIFQLWAAGILAVGFARLAGFTVKESCMWVLGYWLVARIAVIAFG
jgi:hypothetical protein